MDPQQGVCLGCARTLDEIARWSAMTDSEREKVLSLLPMRMTSLRSQIATLATGRDER